MSHTTSNAAVQNELVSALQIKSFTKWINNHLRKRNLQVNDLTNDLADGILLIHLLEILTGKTIGKYDPAPKLRVHAINNLYLCFQLMKAEGIKIENVSAEDIADKNKKLTLGLVWNLILKFQVFGGETQKLLDWCKKVLRKSTPEIAESVDTIHRFFEDGVLLSALVQRFKPHVIDVSDVLRRARAGARHETLAQVFEVLEKEFGVPPLLDVSDMSSVHPDTLDEKAMLTYLGECISAFHQTHRTAKRKPKLRKDSAARSVSSPTFTTTGSSPTASIRPRDGAGDGALNTPYQPTPAEHNPSGAPLLELSDRSVVQELQQELEAWERMVAMSSPKAGPAGTPEAEMGRLHDTLLCIAASRQEAAPLLPAPLPAILPMYIDRWLACLPAATPDFPSSSVNLPSILSAIPSSTAVLKQAAAAIAACLTEVSVRPTLPSYDWTPLLANFVLVVLYTHQKFSGAPRKPVETALVGLAKALKDIVSPPDSGNARQGIQEVFKEALSCLAVLVTQAEGAEGGNLAMKRTGSMSSIAPPQTPPTPSSNDNSERSREVFAVLAPTLSELYRPLEPCSSEHQPTMLKDALASITRHGRTLLPFVKENLSSGFRLHYSMLSQFANILRDIVGAARSAAAALSSKPEEQKEVLEQARALIKSCLDVAIWSTQGADDIKQSILTPLAKLLARVRNSVAALEATGAPQTTVHSIARLTAQQRELAELAIFGMTAIEKEIYKPLERKEAREALTSLRDAAQAARKLAQMTATDGSAETAPTLLSHFDFSFVVATMRKLVRAARDIAAVLVESDAATTEQLLEKARELTGSSGRCMQLGLLYGAPVPGESLEEIDRRFVAETGRFVEALKQLVLLLKQALAKVLSGGGSGSSLVS